MKKNAFLVASAVVCASASLFADNVQGDNVFGVLPVLSKAADTIVAVPWCACSAADDQPIAISNIVKTANLTVGDKVYVLSGSGNSTVYNTWELVEGAGNVLYWQSVTTATASEVKPSQSADAATAARGTAIRLHRQNPTNGVDAVAFYLFGQVGTQSEITTTIANGTSQAPAYTLIAPPGADSVNLLLNSQLTNCSNGDEIVVRGANGANKAYFYESSEAKWKTVSRTFPGGVETLETNAVNNITLQAGLGAWYISRGAAPTLEWKNVTIKSNVE